MLRLVDEFVGTVALLGEEGTGRLGIRDSFRQPKLQLNLTNHRNRTTPDSTLKQVLADDADSLLQPVDGIQHQASSTGRVVKVIDLHAHHVLHPHPESFLAHLLLRLRDAVTHSSSREKLRVQEPLRTTEGVPVFLTEPTRNRIMNLLVRDQRVDVVADVVLAVSEPAHVASPTRKPSRDDVDLAGEGRCHCDIATRNSVGNSGMVNFNWVALLREQVGAIVHLGLNLGLLREDALLIIEALQARLGRLGDCFLMVVRQRLKLRAVQNVHHLARAVGVTELVVKLEALGFDSCL